MRCQEGSHFCSSKASASELCTAFVSVGVVWVWCGCGVSVVSVVIRYHLFEFFFCFFPPSGWPLDSIYFFLAFGNLSVSFRSVVTRMLVYFSLLHTATNIIIAIT